MRLHAANRWARGRVDDRVSLNAFFALAIKLASWRKTSWNGRIRPAISNYQEAMGSLRYTVLDSMVCPSIHEKQKALRSRFG